MTLCERRNVHSFRLRFFRLYLLNSLVYHACFPCNDASHILLNAVEIRLDPSFNLLCDFLLDDPFKQFVNGNFGKSGITAYPYWSDGWSFADDGTVTHAAGALYVGLNVFEGPFALVGEGADSIFRANGSLHVGSGLNSGTPAQVSFLLANGTLDLSSYTFWLGSGIQGSNTRAKSATLVLTDAVLKAKAFTEVQQCGRSAGNIYVCTVALTNATLRCPTPIAPPTATTAARAET